MPFNIGTSMEQLSGTTAYVRTVELGGMRIPMELQYPESEAAFSGWLADGPASGEPVSMTEADWALWRAMGKERNAAGEVNILPMRVSERLMEHDRFILHSAAFRWRDRAWLICAGSGVGKTTQLKTLLELYPDEIGVINGDRPIIEVREDDSVFVHPSPWNGKEDMHGAEGAPLGGIILLRRGEENAIDRISERQAAPAIYSSVFQCYESDGSIHRSAALAERMLKGTPSWLLTNKGVPDSTRLLYATLREEAERLDL